MITKEGSTKIVNFMTPGPGVPVIECGHIGQTVKINAQNSENMLQKKSFFF